MNSELVVTVFDSDEGASTAYKALQQLAQSGDIAILDAATIVKHSDGKSEIKDSQDVDAGHGAFFGVISGALIGLLGGPAGALIGSVAGAATGAASASLIDLGFPKKELEALYSELDPGTSALVVLVEMEWLDKLEAALAKFEGQSARRTLHGKHGKRIAEAVDTIEQELEALKARVKGADDAAKAKYNAQIAALEAKRDAAKQQHERHKQESAAAEQDLKAGVGEAHSDMRQAREKAAGEFKR